jgi:hypothetical protein
MAFLQFEVLYCMRPRAGREFKANDVDIVEEHTSDMAASPVHNRISLSILM